MRLEFSGATEITNRSRESIAETRAASPRHRHSAELQSGSHHFIHETRAGILRAESSMQDPGHEQSVHFRDAKVPVSHSRLVLSASCPKSSIPRMPKRRNALAQSATPLQDDSSVPSRPNARSRQPERSANVCAHAAPSPGASLSNSCSLMACAVERKAPVPSGNSVAVGRSVLRYSRPRVSRSCFRMR